MESKLRSHGDQVALSTLTVALSASRADHAVPAPEFTEAFAAGWGALPQVVFAILTAWPLLAATAIALAYRRVRRSCPAPLPAAT